MSNKKIHPNESGEATPGDLPQTPPLVPEEQSEKQVSPALLAAVQNSLAEAMAQAAEYKDGWQRSVADFQNYRRRVDAERTDAYQSAVGNVIRSYLPILDDLERALATRPADLAWVDGIDLIYRKLQGILTAAGLKRIEAEGMIFDPNFHEAISQEPSPTHQSGQVIAVVQNGYMLGDKVLRPAQVRVAQ